MIGDDDEVPDAREVMEEEEIDYSQIPLLERISMKAHSQRNQLGLKMVDADDCHFLAGERGGCCLKMGRVACPMVGGAQANCTFYESKEDVQEKLSHLPFKSRMNYGMTPPTQEELAAWYDALGVEE